MIGQYLLNTNEKATLSILQNILELNKAKGLPGRGWRQQKGAAAGACGRRQDLGT